MASVNVISVVTPVHNPQPEHLLAAYESLRRQSLPSGWRWEWMVQEDGRTGVLEQLLPADDPRIAIGSGRRGGVVIARNLALARTTGTLIKNLDHDDLLTDGVLRRDITVLESMPDVSWTTSRVLDLLPDSSTVGVDSDPPEGRLAPGAVHEYWVTHGYRAPVHATTICIRRELVIGLGGWMGVPGSDDTGLLIAASMISTGYFHRMVGLLYRKWPGQVTAAPAHTDPEERRWRMSLINERAHAIRDAGTRW